MKRIIGTFLFITVALAASGQKSSDFGAMAGVTSYIGDINPGRLLYDPLPAAGVFYRYNLHPRQSLRASFIYGGLRANDLDFNNSFQISRGASFSGTVGEVAVQFEFNFFKYTLGGKRWNYTPYIAAGGGIAFINTTSYTYVPVIPFSLGFKINIYKNIGLEAEYGFRKTFYDNFDGLKDLVAPADWVWTHNNDWYTFTGIALTWKILNRLAGCPAYSDVDSRRKR